MIDANACDRAGTHQIQKKPMNGVKHFWQFDPNRCQIIYVKKTAVIDLFGCDTPKRQSVGLRVEQFIERVKTAGITSFPVNLCQRLFDRLLHLRRFGAKPFQPPLDDLFFPNPLGDPFGIGLGALRQIFERSQNALQFRVKTLSAVFSKIL